MKRYLFCWPKFALISRGIIFVGQISPLSPVAQLVEQKTCYLEVKGSSPFHSFRPVPTLNFQACMLVLRRERCTVSWLSAMEIPIRQKHFTGNTVNSLCTPLSRKSIKNLIFIELQFPAQTKIYNLYL